MRDNLNFEPFVIGTFEGLSPLSSSRWRTVSFFLMSIQYYPNVREGFDFVTGRAFTILSAMAEGYDPENNRCVTSIQEIQYKTRLCSIRKRINYLVRTHVITINGGLPEDDSTDFRFTINF